MSRSIFYFVKYQDEACAIRKIDGEQAAFYDMIE